RAVILCETDAFVVDESWLDRESAASSQDEGLSALANREVEMIEAALAETHGRISGPSGAAAKLGIPRQTLESKIRRLGIGRSGQKRPSSPSHQDNSHPSLCSSFVILPSLQPNSGIGSSFLSSVSRWRTSCTALLRLYPRKGEMTMRKAALLEVIWRNP